MPNTSQLHRILAAPPERVYRAFTDPNAMVKWLPPHGFTAKVHHLDVRAGGSYKMAFTNFSTGNGHSFGGDYIEVKPNEMCYLGWQQSLVLLAQLVEPEIQDGAES